MYSNDPKDFSAFGESLALPDNLSRMLQFSSPNPMGGTQFNGMPMPSAGGLNPDMSGVSNGPGMFSYEEGGAIGPGGAPMPPMGMPQMAPATPGQAGLSMGGPSKPIDPKMLENQIQQTISQHPQEVAQLKQAIQNLMDSGELTPQELNMATQLATAALQNPDMYPQVRQFAIEQGIATEEDLPQEFDQGLLIVLLVAARAMASQGAPPAQGPQQLPSVPANAPSMREGGALPERSSSSDGSIPIRAHEGEYVIPKEVVRAKGTDFFDKMLAQYKEGGEGSKS